MALVRIEGLVTYYKTLGKGKPLVLLHGWGGSSQSFYEMSRYLSRDHRVIMVDLPGFGQTDAPLEPWNVDRYAQFLLSFIHRLSLRQFALCGHSFGGRVALRFAAVHPHLVDRLILLAASGIRHEKSPEEKTANLLSRIGKKVFSLSPLKHVGDPARWLFYKIIRRSDYYQASEMMKATMRMIIEDDLTPTLSLITVPTLIVWGQKDDYVPLADAHLMQRRIRNARLEIIKGADHFLPRKYPQETALMIQRFLSN